MARRSATGATLGEQSTTAAGRRNEQRHLPGYRPTWHVLDDVIARLSGQSSAVLRHGDSRAAAATVVLWRRSMNVETAGDR